MNFINWLFTFWNTPSFAPDVATSVVAGVIVMAISGCALFLRGWLSAGHLKSKETWRGKQWSEKTAKTVTLFSDPDTPERVDIRGVPEGPLKIEIVKDLGREISGILICVDHGLPVGFVQLLFLPRNQIRVICSGDDDYGFDFIFEAEPPQPNAGPS